MIPLLLCLCAAHPAPVDGRTEATVAVTRTNHLIRSQEDRTVTGWIVADRQRAYAVDEAFRDEVNALLSAGACVVEVAGREGPRASDNPDFRRALNRPRVLRAVWPAAPVGPAF